MEEYEICRHSDSERAQEKGNEDVWTAWARQVAKVGVSKSPGAAPVQDAGVMGVGSRQQLVAVAA